VYVYTYVRVRVHVCLCVCVWAGGWVGVCMYMNWKLWQECLENHVCMYIYTHTHVDSCVWTCVHVHIYSCVCRCVYVHMYACVCTCTYVHICSCVCRCVYIHMYSCVCTCVYVHVYSCVCTCAMCECHNVPSECVAQTTTLIGTLQNDIYIYTPPKNGLIALWSSTNGPVSTFKYCQVVFCQLLRLLSTDILVHQSLSVD